MNNKKNFERIAFEILNADNFFQKDRKFGKLYEKISCINLYCFIGKL